MSLYAIIGSGAAGLAAANAIRARDPAGQILILTADPHVHYSRPGLAYVLSGELPEKQVYQFPREFFARQRFEFVQSGVQAIQTDAHTLRLEDGRALRYDRLLIATGATAAMPEPPGMQLEGVVKLDSMADCQHILNLARRTRRAVVVGGGITALELVEGLAARGVEVHYFLRGDRYWSAVLDEVESRIVERRLAHDGIRIHYHTNLVEVLGQKGRVTAVQAEENGRPLTLPCQMAAFAIGIQPRMELAVQAGLVTTIIGRVGKGETAGGRPKGDADVAGIMRGDSELWRLSPEAVAAQTYAGDNRLRLYLKDNVMVGAVVMGDQTLSRPIQVLIQEQVDLGELRAALLSDNADLARLLGDFWEGYQVKHAAKIA